MPLIQRYMFLTEKQKYLLMIFFSLSLQSLAIWVKNKHYKAKYRKKNKEKFLNFGKGIFVAILLLKLYYNEISKKV